VPQPGRPSAMSQLQNLRTRQARGPPAEALPQQTPISFAIRYIRNIHGWSFHEHCRPIMTGAGAGCGCSLAQRTLIPSKRKTAAT
jgi:hypothetical protein